VPKTQQFNEEQLKPGADRAGEGLKTGADRASKGLQNAADQVSQQAGVTCPKLLHMMPHVIMIYDHWWHVVMIHAQWWHVVW
jgi:hypothetical protein